MKPAKSKITIYKGATFTKPYRWGQPALVGAAIASISAACPAVITTLTPHGLPTVDWPVMIAAKAHGIGDDVVMATKTGANTFTVPVSTIIAPAFKGPGEVVFNPPVDLTGRTARIQFRSSIDSDTVLLELTTENGGITLDNEGIVTLDISAADTAAIAWASAVGQLEIIDGTGHVERFLEITAAVSGEGTR